MYINNKKILLINKHHLLGVLVTLLFVTACNDDKNKPGSFSHSTKTQSLLSSPTSISSDSSENTNSPDEVKTWHGQDLGFVSTDNQVNNKIEALIALGRINAATVSYRNTSTFLSYQANDSDVKLWRAHAAASINKEILNIYDSLDLIFKINNIKPFKDSLEELAKPETIEIYTSVRGVSGINSNDKGIRQQKNEITQETRIITASVLNAVSVLAPSRKEFMLAGSVMFHESGKNLQYALSEDGMITDPSKHQLGISQIDSALSLIPKFAINACEEQREITQTYRDNTNKIVEQLMSFDNKPVQATISDINALAKQTENMAKTLPDKDQDICESG